MIGIESVREMMERVKGEPPPPKLPPRPGLWGPPADDDEDAGDGDEPADE